MDQPPPSCIGRKAFLRVLFQDPRTQNTLIVIRNGEDLPENLVGTDLDVVPAEGASMASVVGYLKHVGENIGWACVCISGRPHVTGLALLGPGKDGPEAVHFDVFKGITWLGVELISPALLQHESVVTRGVRQLSRRARVLATLVHHVGWSGGLTKTKYIDELRNLKADAAEAAWLQATLTTMLGPTVVKSLLDTDASLALGGKRGAWRCRYLLPVLLRRLGAQPLQTARALARYVTGHWPSLVHPPGIVGRRGAVLPGSAQGLLLDLRIASQVSPHAIGAPSARCSTRSLHILNGPIYATNAAGLWRRWTIVRWAAPTLFLWLQAKRNHAIVLDRLPLGARMLAATVKPGWLATEQGPREGSTGRRLS